MTSSPMIVDRVSMLEEVAIAAESWSLEDRRAVKKPETSTISLQYTCHCPPKPTVKVLGYRDSPCPRHASYHYARWSASFHHLHEIRPDNHYMASCFLYLLTLDTTQSSIQ